MFNTLRTWVKTSTNNSSTALTTALQNNTSKIELPDSIHIDTELGLLRTLTKPLYSRLLKRFLETQTSFIDECNTAIKTNDLVLATRLAHTLKGTAATLGMIELAASAAKLEKAFEEENINITPILISVEHDLNIIFNDLRAWHAVNNVNSEKEILTTSSMELSEFRNNIKILATYIDKNVVEALFLAQKLLPNITDKNANKSMVKVISALKLYDFEQAAKHFKSLSINLENFEQ
jgi:HPt (histidine-containing phosphotransfer) domain-containing protein